MFSRHGNPVKGNKEEDEQSASEEGIHQYQIYAGRMNLPRIEVRLYRALLSMSLLLHLVDLRRLQWRWGRCYTRERHAGVDGEGIEYDSTE